MVGTVEQCIKQFFVEAGCLLGEVEEAITVALPEMIAASLADGTLPIGEIIALGILAVTIYMIHQENKAKKDAANSSGEAQEVEGKEKAESETSAATGGNSGDDDDDKQKDDKKEKEQAFKDNDGEELSNMTRQELEENMPEDWDYQEHNGRVHIRDSNGKMRIRIDEPETKPPARTPYRHMHIYDENGNSLDINGNIVDKYDPSGHIPYSD